MRSSTRWSAWATCRRVVTSSGFCCPVWRSCRTDQGRQAMREVIAAPLAGLDLRQHYGHHQSPAVRAGGLIFCSGMLPVDPQTGERRHGTLTSEAHVILGNLKLLLESAGSSLDRLVQGHALIYDSIEYDVLNRVYRQYVANGPPARTGWTAQDEAGFKDQIAVGAAALKCADGLPTRPSVKSFLYPCAHLIRRAVPANPCRWR